MTIPFCEVCQKPILPQSSADTRALGGICPSDGWCVPKPAQEAQPPENAQKEARTDTASIEDLFANHLQTHGVRAETQYRFAPPRRWKADFFIEPNWLIEIEGLLYQGGGRHQTYSGMEKDAEKYNQAVKMGFRVLRYTGRQVRSGEAISDLINALETKGFDS